MEARHAPLIVGPDGPVGDRLARSARPLLGEGRVHSGREFARGKRRRRRRRGEDVQDGQFGVKPLDDLRGEPGGLLRAVGAVGCE